MQEKPLPPVFYVQEFQPLLAGANHIDVKTVISQVDLRTFLANFFNYRPAWLIALYGIRRVFVPFLGLHQGKQKFRPFLTPETIPMQVGKRAAFFTVQMVEEERYWVANSQDKHLTATLGILVEPINAQQKRFHIFTIVHYNNWAGPIYFQIIKPFHHIVVGSMAQAGTKQRA